MRECVHVRACVCAHACVSVRVCVCVCVLLSTIYVVLSIVFFSGFAHVAPIRTVIFCISA